MIRRSRLYKKLVARVVAFLVQEHSRYSQRFPNDLDKLVATLRPGDVVLVEGSQRISQVIKYLTQSSWSHAALYVGDTLLKRGGSYAGDLVDRFGNAAGSLLVEANVETGVTAVPLSKYVNHNMRICRPINLRPGDLSTVLNTVSSQLGNPYNVDHVMELLRYFLPTGLFWRRDRSALVARDRMSQDVICSSQIAMAFQKVRYPILPDITEFDAETSTVTTRRFTLGLLARRKRGPSVFQTGVFTPCDPLLVTPRDFDLSPYFEVVKLGAHDKREFDYKKINWATSVALEPAQQEAKPSRERGRRSVATRIAAVSRKATG